MFIKVAYEIRDPLCCTFCTVKSLLIKHTVTDSSSFDAWIIHPDYIGPWSVFTRMKRIAWTRSLKLHFQFTLQYNSYTLWLTLWPFLLIIFTVTHSSFSPSLLFSLRPSLPIFPVHSTLRREDESWCTVNSISVSPACGSRGNICLWEPGLRQCTQWVLAVQLFVRW